MVAIDLPGFGHSDGRPELIAPDASGAFLARLIDEWGLGAPHVVGPDVGEAGHLATRLGAPGSVPGRVGQRGGRRLRNIVDRNLAVVSAASWPWQQPDGFRLVEHDGGARDADAYALLTPQANEPKAPEPRDFDTLREAARSGRIEVVTGL